MIWRIAEALVCMAWAAGLRLWFLWMWLLAFLRLSDEAVCRVAEWGWDYHDYPDGTLGIPSTSSSTPASGVERISGYDRQDLRLPQAVG